MLDRKEKHNKQNSEWWTSKTEELVKKKKTAYLNWLQTHKEEDRRVYMFLNREVKTQVAKTKTKCGTGNANK